MKFLFLFLCAILTSIFSDCDQFFQSKNDPLIVENVNVITGNLNLAFTDATLNGPVPFSFVRTYSSDGARSKDSEKLLKMRGRLEFEGGWSFLPHLTMVVEPRDHSGTFAYVSDSMGASLMYRGNGKYENYTVLKPFVTTGPCSGNLSGRKNPENHVLHLDAKKGKAKLYLADGTLRIYWGGSDSTYNFRDGALLPRGIRCYKLMEERLPSGHKIFYEYDNHQIKIRICNPNGTKTLGNFELRDMRHPDLQIEGRLSDNKILTIQGTRFDGHQHFLSLKTNRDELHTVGYIKFSGVGPLVEALNFNERRVLNVEYYHPNSEREVKKWNHRPFEMYKVKAIRDGTGVTVASFVYEKGVTAARDADGILTRYLFSENQLNRIEYFDENDELFASERFFWDSTSLIAKSMENKNGIPIFSKTFKYDNYKNVREETIYGNLSGLALGAFSYGNRGSLIGTETFSKWYLYDENTHLLLEEREEDGPTYRYKYLRGTDLVTNKSILANGIVIYEERYIYDNDRLLKQKKCFDGVNERSEHYERDSNTGMIIKVKSDLGEKTFTYNDRNWVIREENPHYAIDTDYDCAGRVIERTLPLGGSNHYSYDRWGNVIVSKEVGCPRKQVAYDLLNRPVMGEICGKQSHLVYDKKGRIFSDTNEFGVVTEYRYGALNRCKEKKIGNVSIKYEYDTQGNIVLEETSAGAITQIAYNSFKKPIHIIYPDGSEIRNLYYKNGELKESSLPDQIQTKYEYDSLHRPLLKRRGVFEEKWEYTGTLLTKYQDERGVIHTYTYDSHSRKISEEHQGRKIIFEYDDLGFVEKMVDGGVTYTEIHDVEGKVISQNEDGFNEISYMYDEERRKVEVVKNTSQGMAVDKFVYDEENRMIQHRDPYGFETTLHYDDFSKTVIDPLGNRSLEVYDAFRRVIQAERQNREGSTISLENFFYDHGNNLIKRITTIYDQDKPQKTIEAEFAYDIMGRVLEEIESRQKKSQFEYDSKGRVRRKIFPNNKTIEFEYDEYDRTVAMNSSDGTVSLEYIFEGLDLVEVRDLVQNNSLKRSYNAFGELVEEISQVGMATAWEYDDSGRKAKFILPDNSAIQYLYNGTCLVSIGKVSSEGNEIYSHHYTKFDPNHHVEEEELIVGLGVMKSKRDLLERPLEMSSKFHKYALSFGPTSLVTKTVNSFTREKDYSYDPLNQIIHEGDKEYQFDSLGNPTDCPVNDLNQITLFQGKKLCYDENGNLIRYGNTEYIYDALNRLTTIIKPDKKIIKYTYDPLSRFLSKECGESKQYYIYDGNSEIGVMDETGNILELKVLGLGIKGDIGAAIAIELNGEIFAPLHDLQGNILALIGTNGEVKECYETTSFGEEVPGNYISPWRFASKRQEEGLVFFGKRFYNPELKRWLTPDPLGFLDSRNLYQYTLNSPLNRLDQFGLKIDVIFNYPIAKPTPPLYPDYTKGNPYKNAFPIHYDKNRFLMPPMLKGLGAIDGIPAELMLICDRIYDFHFTESEYKSQSFNLGDHIHELFEDNGLINVILFQNGINTTTRDWFAMCCGLYNMTPQGALLISVHNPSDGSLHDTVRTFREHMGRETYGIKSLGALITNVLDIFENYAPSSKGLLFAHSEGGLIYCRAYERLSQLYQLKMQKYFYVEGIAPAERIPNTYGIDPDNVYSGADYITGWGKRQVNNLYNVTTVEAKTNWKDRMLFFIDHGLLGDTYSEQTKNKLDKYNTDVGFYVGNQR